MISLESSDDEEAAEVASRPMTHITHPGCRNNLYISRTTLYDRPGHRLNDLGVFTSQPLQVGQLVGLYNGQFWRQEEYEELPQRERIARDRYAISTEDEEGGIIISPPMSGGGGNAARPDPASFPMPIANEPGYDGRSNCILMEYSFLLDEVDIPPASVPEERQDAEFVGVGLVVCRPVGRHRELFWSYGAHYARPYRVGKNCKAPRRNELEDPLTLLGSIPRDCCSVILQ